MMTALTAYTACKRFLLGWSWRITVLLIVLLLATSCDTLLKPAFPDTPSETIRADEPDSSHRDSIESSPAEDNPYETGENDTDHPETKAETEAMTAAATAADTDCAHIPTTIPGVEPTCTESGMTEGKECTLCHEMMEIPVEIPPIGHRDSPASEYRCVSCNRQGVCPTPVLSREGNIVLSWGETLSLSWTLAESTPHPVVYMVTSVNADGGTSGLWETWKSDAAFTYRGIKDGETLTLRVSACLAVDGEPVIQTQSDSAELTVTVTPREMLEAPVFLTGNRVTVQLGKEATVAWGPVAAEGGQIVYGLTLVSPEGVQTPLETQGETWVTIPAALLTREGGYTLLVRAIDGTEAYQSSPETALTINVRVPAPLQEEDYSDPARYASEYFYNYLATLEKGERLQSFFFWL